MKKKKQKKIIKDHIKEIDNQIINLQRQKTLLYNEFYNYDDNSKKENSREFVRQCPAEGCRGFLSTQWKCGLCNKWSCPDCHELKGLDRDVPHTCDPNSVETAKLLKKDSKPCPKCQSLIFKISGCDQMWCTQCKTAFSWKTGRIEHGIIHNPHFHNWNNMQVAQQANAGGGAAAGPCGIINNIDNKIKNNASKLGLYTYSYSYHAKDKCDPLIQLILNIYRNNLHNSEVELRHFQIDYFEKNIDLRMKYLENIITEEELKTLVQRNDKKHRKNIEISQIIQLSNVTINDIILKISNFLEKTVQDKEYYKSEFNASLNIFIKEFEGLQNYCNDILKDISFTYNSVQYAFNNEFTFINNDKSEKESKK